MTRQSLWPMRKSNLFQYIGLDSWDVAVVPDRIHRATARSAGPLNSGAVETKIQALCMRLHPNALAVASYRQQRSY